MTQSVSLEEGLLLANNIAPYVGPDDDLSWLDLDPVPVMNDIDRIMGKLALNEDETEDVLQKMTNLKKKKKKKRLVAKSHPLANIQ